MTITVFAALVFLLGAFTSKVGLIRAQIMLCVLGGTSALSLPALGGATIVVPVMCLPFFAGRAALQGYRQGALARISLTTFWFVAAIVWGVFITLTIPRALAGSLEIMTIDRSSGELGTRLMPLRPVSGNITQVVYALGNVATFVAARFLLRPPGRLTVFRDAVLGLAALNCLAAVINLGEFHLGLPSILSYVRTAYAVFESGNARGTSLMRIHGTFSETSAFSSFSLGLFAFCFSLWMDGIRPRRTGLLAGLLGLFLALSTSGTAYAGAALYAMCLAMMMLRRGYRTGSVPRLALLACWGLLSLGMAGLLVVFETPLVDKVADFFDVTVLSKMDSESGETRGSWNAQAWANLVDSWGLGVGIGTARASSFILVVLSNLGVLGAFFYVRFLWRALRPASDVAPQTAVIARAARQGALATLCAAALSGASFDLGAAFYIYVAGASLGSADGLRLPRPVGGGAA